ncbi:uncharacterized protein B0H18DRAFT_1118143 [Fomitopsis serialis]|uniref:uncharacterized protein n=1 Tax=Fomitopsis serialis TaxID=139415 RepID=UPI002008193E|nr:uncharacterized protein B0H18DRAFT_1118143 [Neoantrodia serialis]KAH9928123.1 hypothetical protein B0H18DRAFT_1118143 [Neoantrodia serialis]
MAIVSLAAPRSRSSVQDVVRASVSSTMLLLLEVVLAEWFVALNAEQMDVRVYKKIGGDVPLRLARHEVIAADECYTSSTMPGMDRTVHKGFVPEDGFNSTEHASKRDALMARPTRNSCDAAASSHLSRTLVHGPKGRLAQSKARAPAAREGQRDTSVALTGSSFPPSDKSYVQVILMCSLWLTTKRGLISASRRQRIPVLELRQAIIDAALAYEITCAPNDDNSDVFHGASAVQPNANIDDLSVEELRARLTQTGVKEDYQKLVLILLRNTCALYKLSQEGCHQPS